MPKRSAPKPKQAETPRLQKVLAAAGFGSRRECEELITSGRVEIDRVVADELGTRVDASKQEVRVDGQRVLVPRLKYFALNKPIGIVSTARDPWARTRVIDLVDDPDRLFTVGRLDKSSSGLILVTNDGDLANRLAHPRYRISKTYRVTVMGKPDAATLRQLRKGIHLSDGKMRAEAVKMKRAHESKSILEIVLTEGRNREIRRMLAQVGHKVQQLTRISIGNLRLGELPVGAYRELSRDEVRRLRKITDGSSRSPKKKTAAKSTTDSKSATGKTTKKAAKTGGKRKGTPKVAKTGGKRKGTPKVAQTGGKRKGTPKVAKTGGKRKGNPKVAKTGGKRKGTPKVAKTGGKRKGTPKGTKTLTTQKGKGKRPTKRGAKGTKRITAKRR